jgi:hypothetical protein
MRAWKAECLALLLTVMWQGAVAAPPKEEPAPDLELLEYLGSFQADDGTWVDPGHLAEMPLPEPKAPITNAGTTDRGDDRTQRPHDREKSRSKDGTAPKRESHE